MIAIFALTFLILRLAATYLLIRVINVQRKLMKRPIDEEIDTFRRDLHHLTIALFLSNIPAIILDVFFVVKGVGLLWVMTSNMPILVFYAGCNATSALIAAVLFNKTYSHAIEVDKHHAESDHTLMNDE